MNDRFRLVVVGDTAVHMQQLARHCQTDFKFGNAAEELNRRINE